MPRSLKLGTRRSLLAWAQSSWVARELERAHPGLRVELVGIETRGDRIQNVPLSQIDGKDFFVAELDAALVQGRVDLCVHSMKDLSLTRAPGITLAAVPRREPPHDVILFGPGAEAAAREGRELRIGTSSPRRLENLPGFLARAWPQARFARFVEIRGNVNTRLARVHEPRSSDRALEGVVLAWAGLIRLWADEKARTELAPLVHGVRWVVVPLQENPSAPAQGALAIECRTNDSAIRDLLAAIHDPAAAEGVALERQVLAEHGGGCHQRFGATAWKHGALGWLTAVRGSDPQGRALDELRWKKPELRSSASIRAWDGVAARGKTARERRLPISGGDSRFLRGVQAVFIAHPRAVDPEIAAVLSRSGARLWVSGMATWERLAELGLRVEGSSEGMGFEALARMTREPVLQLPPLERWAVLTHRDALKSWHAERMVAIPTYSVSHDADVATGADLGGATHVFWGSGSQWDALQGHVSSGCEQATGAGKTARYLADRGARARVFPNRSEWRRWILGQGGRFIP